MRCTTRQPVKRMYKACLQCEKTLMDTVHALLDSRTSIAVKLRIIIAQR